jgi:hypothetical protein
MSSDSFTRSDLIDVYAYFLMILARTNHKTLLIPIIGPIRSSI